MNWSEVPTVLKFWYRPVASEVTLTAILRTDAQIFLDLLSSNCNFIFCLGKAQKKILIWIMSSLSLNDTINEKPIKSNWIFQGGDDRRRVHGGLWAARPHRPPRGTHCLASPWAARRGQVFQVRMCNIARNNYHFPINHFPINHQLGPIIDILQDTDYLPKYGNTITVTLLTRGTLKV